MRRRRRPATKFLRRVSLDLIGRIPKPDEVAVFSADQDPDKRDRLIARMLHDAEHAALCSGVARSAIAEAAVDRQLRYFSRASKRGSPIGARATWASMTWSAS
ncbi:MAG: DUF1549 domain-containing protein [Planctomycetaceae bacterium]